MNVHISYKLHKTPDIEKEVLHSVEKLRKRLQVFRPDLVHLKGSIDHDSPRNDASVSLNLRLPSGQMAVDKSAPMAITAIKAAFADLLQQVGKHKDLLRNSRNWRGRRRGNNRHESQVPFETTIAAVQVPIISADDIRSYVNANLTRLERFVERELVFRESSDQLTAGEVTKEEVVDETIARALGDGGEKPERLALEPWLYHLALNVIRDLSVNDGEGSQVHLEESVRQKNERASDEPQLQFHQPDETFTEETVIADRRIATPEDTAASDEMIRLVQSALKAAPRTDREAFILHAIEGFTVEEIAAITDHRADEVVSSINTVREQLRRSPPLAERFRDSLLANPGTD